MQTEIKNKITQVNSFIDEAFNPAYVSTFQLMIQISIDNILIAVNERGGNKYIAFENYTFQNIYNFDGVADQLETLTKESKLIKHKYKSAVCIIVNNLSTLVPNALFDEDRVKMYLKFNAELQGDEMVMVDNLKSMDSKNVFALPLSIKSKLDYLFSNIKYHHASSALIDTLVLQNKNQTGKKLFVHVQPSHFESVVIDGKKLLFYNTFNYHSAEDFVYYLLFVCEQLQLNPETIDVILLGEIERNSTIYTLTQKYIRKLKFGERNDGAQYSYQLQTLPTHYYFTLFNNYYI